MKRHGDPITLTRLWWYGPEPQTGDTLRTKTGRRYLILEVQGKKLDCVVLGKDGQPGNKEFEWEWKRRS